MTRKQWINSITDEEAVKIHVTFKQVSKTLFALPVMTNKKDHPKHDFDAARRKAVRTFLRRNRLTQYDLNVQYGHLNAGLNINLKCVA